MNQFKFNYNKILEDIQNKTLKYEDMIKYPHLKILRRF